MFIGARVLPQSDHATDRQADRQTDRQLNDCINTRRHTNVRFPLLSVVFLFWFRRVQLTLTWLPVDSLAHDNSHENPQFENHEIHIIAFVL